MIDGLFGPGVSSLNQDNRLSLSDIERIRELRALLKNVKRRLSEIEHNNTIPKNEKNYEMAIMFAIQREIDKRQQMALYSEFKR